MFSNLQAQVQTQQTLTIPIDSTISINTLLDCNNTSSFVTDTDEHHLYTDNTPRSDTMSICPQNQSQRVKVSFLHFDLAAGDTLLAYDGRIPSSTNLIDKASGVGNSQAFGSWVAAHCSPDSNQTGCISFIFKTNGDRTAAAGFKTNIHCLDRNFQIQAPFINHTAEENCDRPYQILTIPPATVFSSCDTVYNDTTFVRIKNSNGQICLDTCLSKSGNMSLTDTFAFGTYLIEYKLKRDSSVAQQVTCFVQPPLLACNDTINVAMDASCRISIDPHLLLETDCHAITDTLQYQITIQDRQGNLIASGTSKNGDYPIITKDLIRFCSDEVYTAEIKRIYYDDLDLSFCNDGVQSNACWTVLRFEDKLPPLFIDPIQTDTIYTCDINTMPDALSLAAPAVFENCDTPQVNLKEIAIPTDAKICDTNRYYLVVWEARDACGNSSTREDTLKIFRPGADKVIRPQDVLLNCGIDDITILSDDTNPLGVPHLKIGFQDNGIFIPTDTIPLVENVMVCNYQLLHTDELVKVNCSEKYYRHWQVLDWCANERGLPIDTQLIEFRDTLAPVIRCTDFSTLATAEHIALPNTTCQIAVDFPLPEATDDCHANPTVAEFTVEVLTNNIWTILSTSLATSGELEYDTFRVGYRAFDDCQITQPKSDTCYRYFIIHDLTTPTAICGDGLSVSLGNRDTTFVHADAIDGGSFDMCELDTILVRRTLCNNISAYQGKINPYVIERLGPNVDPIGWDAYLGFTCCDVHHPIFAELLVIDKKGNYNTCSTNIKVEDQIRPICQPLAPVSVFCDEYHAEDFGSSTDINGNDAFDVTEWTPLMGDLETYYNLEFGDPMLVCEDNLRCDPPMMEQEYQLVKQDCGEAIIKRRYRVIDYGKNQSAWEEQTINLTYRANWKITFPIDVQGDCDARFGPPTEPPIQNGHCDQLSWEYEDEFFEAANDIFVKVLRTYYIINWCIYEPGDTPLIIRREENYQKFVTNPKMICSDSLADVGFIKYTQVLKVVDEENPLLLIGKVDTIITGKGDVYPLGEEDQTLGSAPFECDAVKVFQVFGRDCNEAVSESLNYQWEFLMDGTILATGIGDTFSQIVYPGPLYEARWWVTDVFANTSLIAEHYTFIDGLAPVPYCSGGLVTEIMPSHRFAIISADMLDLGSYDNCSDQSNLKIRLWHPVLNVPRPETAADVMALPDVLKLGCFFVGTQEISFYVMDEAGNFDYCTTNVIIQNNMQSCARRNVAGAIINQAGEAIEDVEIIVESTDVNLSMMSNDTGGFEFTMPDGADYTVLPYKNDDPLNGVSTYDLVLISRHILGLNKFDTPYKYIAADINQSGTVTAFDLVQLRQLILNIIPIFPNNTSWRFVDMVHEFDTMEAGMELASQHEEKTIRNLSSDRLDMDFLGVKIGDLNGSAVSNRSAASQGRSQQDYFTLTTDNQVLEKGQMYTVPFYGQYFEVINGYQFTLTFPYLKLIHIEGGVANTEHFGRTLADRGVLTTSWHSLQSHESTTPLFTLVFQATKAGPLNELLNITSDHTPAEAYSFSGTFFNVSLAFSEPSPIPFMVYQNTPNPFNQQTNITFDLPAKGNAVFQLVNSQGQIVRKEEAEYQKGVNEIPLDTRDLPDGTYYYQLSTPFGVVTKKMIKVQ
ncbi:MAG: T9SS type A sorting domain-containing protein [Saprospiraceae bacterium]